MTDAERVMEHVISIGECWVWQGPVRDGYGIMSLRRRSVRSHRVMYEAHFGPISAGLVIDHLCRNRACVNPEHLEAVTPRENNLRSTSVSGLNARKTACPKGHPYDYRVGTTGSRDCRICRYERSKKSYRRHSAKRIAHQRANYQRNIERERAAGRARYWRNKAAHLNEEEVR